MECPRGDRTKMPNRHTAIEQRACHFGPERSTVTEDRVAAMAVHVDTGKASMQTAHPLGDGPFFAGTALPWGGQAGPQAERGEVRGIHQSVGSRSPAG